MSRFKLFSKYPRNVGSVGNNYEHCAFMSKGIGQFKPTDGANPTIGAVGTLEQVEEHRVEVLVKDEGKHEEIRGAVEELKKIHPYEEVAYEVYKLEDF